MDFGLSAYDKTLIRDIVEGYSNETPLAILRHFQRIFGIDITPAHYIEFGRVMGGMLRPINGGAIQTLHLC